MSIKLAIYVESCGISNSGEADFHWRKINSDNDQPREEPPILREKIIERGNGEKGEVEVLLHKEEPSLVLLRDKDKLLLQVTVPSSAPNRKKKYSRVVRNSVAWLGEANPDNESAIRMLAVRMLKSFLGDKSFIEDIDEAVDFDDNDPKKFKVSFDKIAQLTTDQKASNFKIENKYPAQDSENSIKIKSPEEINILALKLQNYCLPKKDGPLVVVTEIPPVKGILHKAKVWRGLVHEVALSSSQNSNERSSPSQLLPPTEEISSNQPNQVTEGQEQQDTKEEASSQETGKKNLKIILLRVMVLVSLIFVIVTLYWLENKEQERLQKTPIPQILISP